MRWLVLCMVPALALAQGTTPKPSPTEYDVWANAGPVDIGAEYMVHSFSNGEQMFLAERFLVVEVAFYPPLKTQEIQIDLAKFGLRLNHKTLLPAVAPGQVAAALKQPAWMRQQRGGLSGGVGAGPVDIPIGGQSPYPPQQRPNPPRAPQPDPPGGIERTKDASPEEVLLQTALPAGTHKGPVSGFVYFPFTGKPSSLKAVELVYDGATLKLK